jgi:hypothetical protein
MVLELDRPVRPADLRHQGLLVLPSFAWSAIRDA